MSAAEPMVTAETEETLRVMAHVRDLNRSVAEGALQVATASGIAEPVNRALQRIEELPFLLCDFRFSDASFWRECTRQLPAISEDAMRTGAQVQLARHLLSVAWHCGRAGAGPRLLLGIEREVGLLITTLRFAQLDAIAVAHAAEVSRRWADVPGFWTRLLDTARRGSDERWSRFQIHALRLLGREQL